MSKPMQKKTKLVLIILVVFLLLGACFGAVALYAHHELTKPRFELTGAERLPVRELPTEIEDAVSYVGELYQKAVAADDVEVSWHTDAKLKDYAEAWDAPFSEKDLNVMAYILEHADENDKNRVKSLYPDVGSVLKAENEGVYVFDLKPELVLDLAARRGRYNDKNEYIDDDYYFIDLTVDPAYIDTAAIQQSDIYANFVKEFLDALSVKKIDFEVTGVKFSFKINHRYNELDSLNITRSYRVTADITLLGDYAALLPEGETDAHVILPYEATEKINFKYYGAYFTTHCIAVKKGDMQALPARVTVKDKEEQENFTLSFVPSDESMLKIDADGVMSVLKYTDTPLTVTMTLDYHDHTYTDTLTVYITELEVATEDGN